METTELIDLLSRGEDSRQQFKTDINNAAKMMSSNDPNTTEARNGLDTSRVLLDDTELDSAVDVS